MNNSKQNSAELITHYNKALLSLDSDSCLAIETDFKLLAIIFLDNTKLIKLFETKSISKNSKLNILKDIIDPLELNLKTIKFLLVLANNNRLNLLLKIIEGFQILLSKMRKETEIKITTAWNLSLSEQNLIEKILADRFINQPIVRFLVEPKILGGIIIQSKAKTLDNSIINQLNKLAKTTMKMIAGL